MAIFMTGDTHGDFSRFSARAFPEQKDLSKGDYMIICGDFGGIWDGGESSDGCGRITPSRLCLLMGTMKTW